MWVSVTVGLRAKMLLLSWMRWMCALYVRQIRLAAIHCTCTELQIDEKSNKQIVDRVAESSPRNKKTKNIFRKNPFVWEQRNCVCVCEILFSFFPWRKATAISSDLGQIRVTNSMANSNRMFDSTAKQLILYMKWIRAPHTQNKQMLRAVAVRSRARPRERDATKTIELPLVRAI